MTDTRITLSETAEATLKAIAGQLRLPEDLLPTERLEIALDTLCDSYDSVAFTADGDDPEGEPINAAQLHMAIQNITDPDISTGFTQPAASDEQPGATDQALYEGIREKVPTNSIVRGVEAIKSKEPGPDPVYELSQRVVVAVFNHTPEADWDTADTKRLVADTLKSIAVGQASKNNGEVDTENH